MILLINPPLVKPSEPPPGIARLYGALTGAGVKCSVIDANIEGILHLLQQKPAGSDRWTMRAVRNRERNLDFVRSRRGYSDLARYKRAVSDLNHLLEKAANGGAGRLSLSNYQGLELSPVRSRDLLRASEAYAQDPFYEYFSKRICEAVENGSPETIGFSLNFLSQALTAFAMIGFVRAKFGRIRIILGGGLITSWVRKPGWENPFSGLVDQIVDGPGEQMLLELGESVNGGMRRSYLERERGKWGDGETRCTIEFLSPTHPLTHSPIHRLKSKPAYGPFPMRDYFAPGPIVPYSASSGCYWNRCAFCPEKAEKTPYEPIAPEAAARQARELVSEFRPVLLHFLDSALSPALLKKIAQYPPGAPWYGFVRITKSLADEDFCRELKKSGCVMLKLGLESGDQGVIDAEGKGIDLGIASRALVSLKKAGIGAYAYLLFGTPSESEAAARNTLDFIARHSQWIDFLNLAIFNMPVNSPDAERLGTAPHYEADLSLYTGFSHPKGWDRGLVRRFLEKEFKKHPAVAPIVVKDPPFFTSNHAPFFCGRISPQSTQRTLRKA